MNKSDFRLAPAYYGNNKETSREIIYIPRTLLVYGNLFESENSKLEYLSLDVLENKSLMELINSGFEENGFDINKLKERGWGFRGVWIPLNSVVKYKKSSNRKIKNRNLDEILRSVHSCLMSIYSVFSFYEDVLESGEELVDGEDYEEEDEEDDYKDLFEIISVKKDYKDEWWKRGEKPWGEAW